MTILGERLRHSRERKDLKQTDVMRLIGLNNKTLSGYENGVSEPDSETLAKLADLYGVTTDYLHGRTSYPHIEARKPTGNIPIEERLRKEGILTGQKSYEYSDKSPMSDSVDRRNISVPNIKEMRTEGYGTSDKIKWIPVLGHIKAGYDLYAEQQVIDVQPVAKDAVSDGAEYFFLVVKGDSMIGDGIKEGMRVLVRRQEWVDEGKIGVVLVNGDEATLKRVYVQDGGMVTLVASNPSYPPRILSAADAKIQGQVKQVVWDV